MKTAPSRASCFAPRFATLFIIYQACRAPHIPLMLMAQIAIITALIASADYGAAVAMLMPMR